MSREQFHSLIEEARLINETANQPHHSGLRERTLSSVAARMAATVFARMVPGRPTCVSVTMPDGREVVRNLDRHAATHFDSFKLADGTIDADRLFNLPR